MNTPNYFIIKKYYESSWKTPSWVMRNKTMASKSRLQLRAQYARKLQLVVDLRGWIDALSILSSRQAAPKTLSRRQPFNSMKSTISRTERYWIQNKFSNVNQRGLWEQHRSRGARDSIGFDGREKTTAWGGPSLVVWYLASVCLPVLREQRCY